MRLISLTFLLLQLALPSLAQDLPNYRDVYVNDFAAVIPAEDEQIIRDKLKEVKEARDIEFTVVTINSMSDYGHTGGIEPFATALFNHWGVGNASRNDGVMLLVAMSDRQLRIEVGSGYRQSMNDPMQEIIDDVIIPRFKRDAYLDGIHHGVDHIIHQVSGTWPGEFDVGPGAKMIAAARRLIEQLGAWIGLLLVPVLAAGAGVVRRWSRYRPRRCPVDGSKMELLDEEWDDHHLQDGQITEERLKSVDYDVWQCEKCDHITVEAYRAWISRYGACRSCGYRTVEGVSTTLTPATTTATGLKQIEYSCHHCGDTWLVTRTIPRVSKSSSSGGSFGGGSSSGGGASGSW